MGSKGHGKQAKTFSIGAPTSCGIRVRQKYARPTGWKPPQVVLGHARMDVTQVYAEKNLALAREIARQSG